MASFDVSGITKLNDIFGKMSDVPNDVVTDILKEMGNVAAKAEESSGRSMGIYDPEWSGTHVLDSIKVNKPKIDKYGGSVTVTFKGTRTRGNTKTRNAEIAFINEFGADHKNIPARPFIKTAITQNEDAIFKAGEKVFDEWLDSTNK